MDTTRFPLVVITLPPVVTTANIDAHCARLDRELFSLGRYAVVVDARRVDEGSFRAPMRKYAGETYAQHDVKFRRYCISESYVISSAMQRGLLTAIRWLQAAPWPTANFGTMEEAEAWSRKHIDADAKG